LTRIVAISVACNVNSLMTWFPSSIDLLRMAWGRSMSVFEAERSVPDRAALVEHDWLR
jgi:hypothetical protein